MKELTEATMCTEIFALCLQEPRTIEEMTNIIYKNLYAKNMIRIYLSTEILMARGVLVPTFAEKTLRFKISDEILNGYKSRFKEGGKKWKNKIF